MVLQQHHILEPRRFKLRPKVNNIYHSPGSPGGPGGPPSSPSSPGGPLLPRGPGGPGSPGGHMHSVCRFTVLTAVSSS